MTATKNNCNLKTLNILIFLSLNLVFVSFAQSLAAQKGNAIIKGRIVTADGNSAYVLVQLKKLKVAVETDENGDFKLSNLPAANDSLIISSIGLQRLAIAVNIEPASEINIGIIHLKTNIAQLQDVEVTGRIKQSYKSDYTFFSNKVETPSALTPQSVNVITKELITDKMEFTLKDAVSDAAGVNQYSGYDEYAIRGFRAENARNINGLRGYNTTYTSNMLVNIERIEVIKGPVATLYGNCDPGGTINLVTKKPLATPESSISIFGGSWNHFRAAGDVTGAINKSKTLMYRFNAGYDNAKSFRNQFYAKSYELAPSFTFIPNDKLKINVDFSVSHVNTILDRGQPGFFNDTTLKTTSIKLNVAQPGDYLHEIDFASVITASYKLTKNINFNTGFLNYITHQNVAEHGLNSYATNDSVYLLYDAWKYHTSTNTITNYFTWQPHFKNISNRFLFGYDYIKSSINLNQQYYELPDIFGEGSGIVGIFSLQHPLYIKRTVSSYKISDFNSDAANVNAEVFATQGIYFQDEITVADWKFLLGIRQEFYGDGDDDDESMHENITLPRLSVLYSVKAHLHVYATYNTGFDPFEASISTEEFNEPFKPVKSRLFEAGIKADILNNALSASAALYNLTVTNVAVNANDISNPNLYVQQGENRSQGIETEIAGNILSNLSITANYSYCLAKIIKSKVPQQVGEIAENAPKNSSSSWIKYTINKGALKGFGISAGHSQAGVRNTLQSNFILPSYVIINSGLHYSIKHFGAAINLYNITNKTYWLGAYNNTYKWPGAPRNFMCSLAYNFQ